MGQKVHPFIFRIGIIYSWPSKWFARKGFREYLRADVLLREFLVQSLKGAGVVRIEIERTSTGGATVTIFAAKPGLIIGRGGAQIEELKRNLKTKFHFAGSLTLNIQEIEKPSLYGAVIAEGVKLDLEKRVPFRTVIKQALERANKAGARGAKKHPLAFFAQEPKN